MIFVDKFAVQNSLITPAAFPVGIAPPKNIKDQKWLLMLSGVCIINLKGNSEDWRRETLSIGLDIRRALSKTISDFAIRRPTGTEDNQYFLAFQVEQTLPFAAISSIFTMDKTVNAGFAVDSWHTDDSGTGTEAIIPGTNQPLTATGTTDPVTGAIINKLFNGITVDLAVRNSKSTLHRVSFHVTLQGKIFFIVKTF